MIHGQLRLGQLRAAVLAGIVVTHHQRATREGDLEATRNPYIVDQADDEGFGYGELGSVNALLGGFQNFCFLLEQEHYCPAHADDVEWLIRCIKQ